MALGLGEGGEQNAPLGRAVIGGLLVATVFTLVIVPLVYSVLRRGEERGPADVLQIRPDRIDDRFLTDHPKHNHSFPSEPEKEAGMGCSRTWAARPLWARDFNVRAYPADHKSG